ncbi:MAG TPA: hypothetical protein PLH30_03975 [Bacteroidales bacterium]|nr:hypothetical protein [Bacteroidales bacterium]
MKKEHFQPYAALFLGIITQLTQIAWLRSVFALFDGNEIFSGICLAIWMLFTGLGTRFYRKNLFQKHKLIPVVAFIIQGFFPLMMEVLAISLRNHVFIAGLMPPLHWSTTFILVWFAPFCLLSGMLYAWLVEKSEGSKIYGMESIGGMLAGIVSLVLLLAFPQKEISLYLLILLGFVNTALWLNIQYKVKIIYTLLLALVIIILFIRIDLPEKANRKLFEGQQMLSMLETPIGRLHLTSYYGDTNIYVNGQPYCSSYSGPECTENLHFAMLQRPKSSSLLVIGEIVPRLLQETSLWNFDKIEAIEPNPFVWPWIEQFLQQQAIPNFQLRKGDAIHQAKMLNQKFDVIILNNSDPLNLSSNRLISYEYFGLLKEKLNTTGLICCGLSSAVNYPQSQMLEVYSCIYRTLSQNFRYILLIAGTRTWFLASDSSLNQDWQDLMENAAIKSEYVNTNYFEPSELASKAQDILTRIDHKSPINAAFQPKAFAFQSLYWLNLNSARPLWILLGILVLIILILWRQSSQGILVFLGGFMASTGQVLILLLTQIVLGNLYILTGLIFGIFMGGLALGSFSKSFTHIKPPWVLFLMAIALCLPSLIFSFSDPWQIPNVLAYFILLGDVLIIAFLMGTTYRISLSSSQEGAPLLAASYYAADLAGATLGMLIPPLFLIPLFGIPVTTILIALLCIITSFLIYKK